MLYGLGMKDAIWIGFGEREEGTAMQWRTFCTFTKCTNPVYAYFISTGYLVPLETQPLALFPGQRGPVDGSNILMVTKSSSHLSSGDGLGLALASIEPIIVTASHKRFSYDWTHRVSGSIEGWMVQPRSDTHRKDLSMENRM